MKMVNIDKSNHSIHHPSSIITIMVVVVDMSNSTMASKTIHANVKVVRIVENMDIRKKKVIEDMRSVVRLMENMKGRGAVVAVVVVAHRVMNDRIMKKIEIVTNYLTMVINMELVMMTTVTM